MSKNKATHLEKIGTGLAIYKRGVSPYWYARIWNSRSKNYLVRSTKCTVKADAIEEASAIREQISGHQRILKVPQEYTFKYFAKQQMIIQQRQVQRGKKSPRYVSDDVKLLEREENGILAVFGEKDVREITTGDLREYLDLLNRNRSSQLASDTQNRHLYVINKVLKLAFERKLVSALPIMPREKNNDQPRPSFSPNELSIILRELEALVIQGDQIVSGCAISHDLLSLIGLLAHSGLRPTEKEVYALQHADVDVVSNQENPHLVLTIGQSKTIPRTVVTLAEAKSFYEKKIKSRAYESEAEFVFFPNFPDRKRAADVARRQFKWLLRRLELQHDKWGNGRVLYSLRHYYVQQRLASEVNIYQLASNIGSSVNTIERFYGRFPSPTDQRAAALNSGGTKSRDIRGAKSKTYDDLEILALHADGISLQEICDLTGQSKLKIELLVINAG